MSSNGEKVASGEAFPGIDRGEDFFGGLFSKTFEAGYGAIFASALESTEGADGKLVVESFDFFWPEPLEFKEFEEGFGKFGSEVEMVLEATSGGEFVELLLQGVAYAFDSFELIVFCTLEEIALEVPDDVCAVAVGAGFEGVFALKLEQKGDFFESSGEIFGSQGHGRTMSPSRQSSSSERRKCVLIDLLSPSIRWSSLGSHRR